MTTYDEKKQALANYLGVDVEEIEEGYTTDYFEVNGEEYLVCTDEEADQHFNEDIENFIDDCGIEGFSESFQQWIMNYALDQDWFSDAQRESWEYYVQDIEDENDSTYENRLIAEMVDEGILDGENDFHYDEDDEDQLSPLLNDDIDLDEKKEEFIDYLCNREDPVEWYEFNFGFGRDFTDMIKNGNGPSLDYDAIANEIKSWDGRGSNLASYDGEEIELDNDLFAYRIN